MRLPRRLAACALIVVLVGCSRDEFPAGTARVVDVVAGDTIRVKLGKTVETVRLIGVDTPETKHPDKGVECFGPEAFERTKEFVGAGTVVRLERDANTRDRYGRLLAYVHRAQDELFINETLLLEGFARALPFDDTPAFHDRFALAEDAARRAGVGLWGACRQ
ncbi:MAG: thermonuclease family protein [Ilumatobacteraceae bacterium]